MARSKKNNAKKKAKKKAVQFQMGWGGLTALVISTLCVLLWTFIMGFWVGQKLIGKKNMSRRNITVLDKLNEEVPVETPRIQVPDRPVEPAFPPVTAGSDTAPLRPETGQAVEKHGKRESLPIEVIGGGTHTPSAIKAEQPEAPQPEKKAVENRKNAAQPVKSAKDTTLKKDAEKETASAAKTYFVLQIASYRERAKAEKQAAQWRKKGITAQVSRVSIKKKGIWYRVYLGHYGSVQDATAGAKRLARKEGIRSYVVPVKP